MQRTLLVGDTRLDGLDFITALYWPKAIHEGNDTAQLFITNNATEEQRQAIMSIVSGQAKGDGPFALFAGTFKYFLEPQFVDIKVNLNRKKVVFQYLVLWMYRLKVSQIL